MRKRQLLQRPDNFLLDYDHELAKNLIFAGLGKDIGSAIYRDSSRYGKHGTLTTMTPSSDWVYSPQLSRFALKFNDAGKIVVGALTGDASPYTISLWAQRNTIIDGYSAITGGTLPYKDALWVYENGNVAYGNANLGGAYSSWNGLWTDKTLFHHLAIVVTNNANGQYTYLYFDGIYKGLSVGAITAEGVFDAFTIGMLATEHTYKWVGQISDVLIHRSILSYGAIQKLANPFDPMLDGMLLPPKRKIFPGYTLPTAINTPSTNNIAIVKISSPKFTSRPETFILNSNHQLITGLRYAACGNSPYTTTYFDSGPYKSNGIFTLMDPPKNWIWDTYLNRFVIDLNYSGAGANDKISLSPAVVSTNTFTFSAWLKPMSSVDQYGTIFAQGATRGFYYHGTNDATNNLKIDWYNAGSNFCTTLLTNTKWNHIAAVMKNGATMDFYINGKYSNTTSGTYYATTFDNIGDDPSTETYIGSIADIMLWDIALNSYQIQQLANPYNIMLDGLLQSSKRKTFVGYTLPDSTSTSITISAVRQRPYKTRTKRPDDFIVDQNHYLANGLIFAGCGRSPGSATYVDSSIYQTNGILTTMTPTIDWVWDEQIGQWVLEFDGSDDYVSVLSTPSFRLSGDKSLCCWIKMPSLSTGCGFTGKSNSTVYGMALGYGWNGNGFMALCWNSTNNPWIARDATRDYEWCHLSAVQHGSTRYLYVWDRWGLRSQSHGTGTHSWDHADPFRIGDAGAQKPPAGTKIGSVLVYNRALSLVETKVLSNPYDPMMNGLLRSVKRKIYAGIYIEPSIVTPTTPIVSNKAIIKRIRKKLIERPESFTLDYSHSLAQGLKFAGLQQIPGSELYTDSSAYHIPSKLINSTIAYNWIYDAILKRMILQLDGVNDFVDITIPPIISAPCSIVGWFNVPSASTIYTIAGVSDYDNPSTDNHILFELSRGTLGRVAASTWNVTGAYAVSNDAFTANTWFHGAAVFSSSTNRVAYLNGKPGSVETTNLAAVAVDRGQLGCNRINTTSLYRLFSGRMTDILFYNRVLSLSEIQQLGDPANIMLSGMLREPKRQYYAVSTYNPPVVDTIRPMSFLRLSSYNRRSVLLWKR